MKLRAVLKGETIVVPMQGGFVRRPAPSDGIEVDVGDTCAFLPAVEAAHALTDLADRMEGARKRRRR